MPKDIGFSVLVFIQSFRSADFSFFSVMFSVFIQNTSGFSVLVSDVVFGFSYFALFGLRFNFDLSGNSSRIAAKNQCY